MERAGFCLTLAAGFFSVFLLGWQGMNGASAGWVSGFLAVFWSLLMMLRLMTLTTPAPRVDGTGHLAQKIIGVYHEWKEESAQQTLETSFGGSFFLFSVAAFIFAAWQVYCAAFPASEPTLVAMGEQMDLFFDADAAPAMAQGFFFEWGQGFMLLLGFLMMGFILRSHGIDKKIVRPAMLVLCFYALAGYITFAGMDGAAKTGLVEVNFMGNGNGALPYLIPAGQTPSLFDVLLVENGIVGLMVLAFLTFIPLGYIALAAQNVRSDRMVVFCGLVPGVLLILSLFLPFTAFLGGFMALCWMAIFLSWGYAENSLTKEQK